MLSIIRRHLRGPVHLRIPKVWRRIRSDLGRPRLIRALEANNAASESPLLGDAPVMVSLTTFGDRVDRAHLPIESIARGDLRPERMLLWLDDPGRFSDLTPQLRRLQSRGLEIRLTKNIGSHSKYYPALPLVAGSGLKLVTADDDILYPSTWLKGFVDAAELEPDVIHCYLSHLMTFKDGALRPYREWLRNWSDQPSARVFAAGVSGVIYPDRMVDELIDRGEKFLDCTPRADDVWINFVAAASSIRVRQIGAYPVHFAKLPSIGADRLAITNVRGGGNDEQISRTYPSELLRAIAAAD